MNRDKAKGAVNEAVGKAQRKVGRITGSEKTEAKGAIRQAKGNLQQAKGAVKDAAKSVVRRARASADSAPRARVTTRTTTTRVKTTRSRPT